MQRVVAQGDTRPMADNRESMEDLQRILDAREPLYRKADVVIDTSKAISGTEHRIAGREACNRRSYTSEVSSILSAFLRSLHYNAYYVTLGSCKPELRRLAACAARSSEESFTACSK